MIKRSDNIGKIIEITPYLKNEGVSHFDAEVKSVIRELTACIDNYQTQGISSLKNIQFNHL